METKSKTKRGILIFLVVLLAAIIAVPALHGSTPEAVQTGQTEKVLDGQYVNWLDKLFDENGAMIFVLWFASLFGASLVFKARQSRGG